MVMMMKKESVVAVLMVVLVVAAQVQAQHGPRPPAPAGSGHLPPPKRHCASGCALECLRFKQGPVAYISCFNMCVLKCKHMPSDSVFNCTSSCAHSKTHNLANTATEAQKVERYVDSCYDSCSKKH